MMIQDIKIEAGKAAPAFGGVIFSAITLNEMVACATLAYIALQAAYLVWKWRREARKGGKE